MCEKPDAKLLDARKHCWNISEEPLNDDKPHQNYNHSFYIELLLDVWLESRKKNVLDPDYLQKYILFIIDFICLNWIGNGRNIVDEKEIQLLFLIVIYIHKDFAKICGDALGFKEIQDIYGLWPDSFFCKNANESLFPVSYVAYSFSVFYWSIKMVAKKIFSNSL